MKCILLLISLTLSLNSCGLIEPPKPDMFEFLNIKPISSNEIKEINNEIITLNTDLKKELFLNRLENADQEKRKESGNIVLKYGYNSPEDKNHCKNIIRTDYINYLKVKKYLETYDYPNPKFDKSYTFIYITGHQGNFEKEKVLFPFFFKVYKENKLDEELFLFLLNEMHEAKNGFLYEFKNNETWSERIEILIKVLDLL